MLARRLAALAAVTALVSACGAAESPLSPSSDADTVEAAAEPTLPDVTPFDVADGEPAPDVKRAAVTFLEALLNHPEGEGTPGSARDRLDAADVPADGVELETPLLTEDAAAAAQVVYPQLGGLTDTQASIMAVIQHSVLRDGDLTTQTRTVDLRLDRTGDTDWEVTEIADSGGEEPEPEVELSEPAQRVLSSDGINLPDSARWDILTGEIDDRLLELMLTLSADHIISVVTLATGHPVNVFDRDSVSNHIHGRAVDIWAIDGVTIAELGNLEEEDPNPARTLMETALREGATEVGGPWAITLPEGSSFTDTVHEDHLHIGYKQ